MVTKPFFKNLKKPFMLSAILFITALPSIAQGTKVTPPDTKVVPAAASSSDQAPDSVMKKLSDLIHAGKYAEAQQTVTALLILYPDDQRLAKAKTLLGKTLSSSKPADTGVSTNPPTGNVVSAPAAANTNAEALTGMGRVDYNALIALARQAQQNPDLEGQKKSLNQFMDQSSPFLQKHPDQILLWQLRAASAISLNDPMAGYDAGQKLLAAGAADSNDPKLQQLVAELKNKGWLDAKEATKQAKYWILGIWSMHCSTSDGDSCGRYNVEFSMSDSLIEGFATINGIKEAKPHFKVTIPDSGEIRFEDLWIAEDKRRLWTFSSEIADRNQTMKIVGSYRKFKHTTTYVFNKQ